MYNKSELTFMKVEEALEVDWAHIMFNNLCSRLDRWTKMQSNMQVNGKYEDRIETCYSTLVLERLFRYMFQKDFKVVVKNKKKLRRRERKPRRKCNMFWIVEEEHQKDLQRPWTK